MGTKTAATNRSDTDRLTTKALVTVRRRVLNVTIPQTTRFSTAEISPMTDQQTRRYTGAAAGTGVLVLFMAGSRVVLRSLEIASYYYRGKQ